jgi:5-methyltetrahydrofolate--homocysteine methyltransferase
MNFERLHRAVEDGDAATVVECVKEAIEAGVAIKLILDDGLIYPMSLVGEKFKRSEVFIPEVIISAKAMQAGLKALEPHFAKSGIKPAGRVVIGTVKGDLHDIGKNIVSMMLKGAGFEIEDLGIDVAPQKFIDRLKGTSADIIAMSSLLTTSMGSMRDTINSLKMSGLRDKVKVMVGGAPVTQEFARSIGADGYAKDAASAVDKAKELMLGKTRC